MRVYEDKAECEAATSVNSWGLMASAFEATQSVTNGECNTLEVDEGFYISLKVEFEACPAVMKTEDPVDGKSGAASTSANWASDMGVGVIATCGVVLTGLVLCLIKIVSA